MSPAIANHAGGPRTAAGIENCKYNATRHGLTGSQIVIKGENPAHYDTLRSSLLTEHQPATEEESMLVERIAQNWWKLQRAERYERELLDYAQATGESPFATQRFLNFMRYRNSIERAWNRARTELAALKSAANAAEKAAAKSACTTGQSVLHIAATNVSRAPFPSPCEPTSGTLPSSATADPRPPATLPSSAVRRNG